MTDTARAAVVSAEVVTMVYHVPLSAFELTARDPRWTPQNRRVAEAVLEFRRRLEEIFNEPRK